MQLHHIDGDPGNNNELNLAVLCQLCHDETLLKGGFGRKLNADSVIEFRDDWVRRVSERRAKADEFAAMRMAGVHAVPRIPTTVEEAETFGIPQRDALATYTESLPAILGRSYALAAPRRTSGVTSQMVQASGEVIDVVVQILVHLATWFPKDHFDGKLASEYFSSYINDRARWHRALAEPEGAGTGGTIVMTITAAAVLEDAKAAVDDMVSALLLHRGGFDLPKWRARWRAAAGPFSEA